tara:strand:- start:614 stop:724 length:111 start_codon:yes stop_codon:yes gene_type:complete
MVAQHALMHQKPLNVTLGSMAGPLAKRLACEKAKTR